MHSTVIRFFKHGWNPVGFKHYWLYGSRHHDMPLFISFLSAIAFAHLRNIKKNLLHLSKNYAFIYITLDVFFHRLKILYSKAKILNRNDG